MHELQLTEQVLSLVLLHARQRGVRRVTRVVLEVGALRGVHLDWMQRFFDRLSAGTEAAGAQLTVESIAPRLACTACQHAFDVTLEALPVAACPACGFSQGRILAGLEYNVKQIEVIV